MADISQIAILPQLSLFSRPSMQLAVDRDVVSWHRPLGQPDLDHPILFSFLGSKELYPKLDESKLIIALKLSLKKKNDAALAEADWEKVGLVNNGMHSLFRSVRVMIGDTEVSANFNYAYKAYFESLLGFSESAKKGLMTVQGWGDEGDTDKASKARNKLTSPTTATKVDNTFMFVGKLHLDLRFQERAILGDTPIRLEFVPNPSEFYLMNGDTANLTAKLEITDCLFKLVSEKATHFITSAHDAALKKASACYPIAHTEIKTFNLPSGARDASIDHVVHGPLPRRVFLGLVSNSAFNGALNKNPFYFKDYGVKHLAFYLNGEQYPQRAFTPNFGANLYALEFSSLYEALDQDNTDTMCTLSYQDYKNGNVIYAVNFSPDLSSGPGSVGHLSPMKHGSLRVSIQFDSPLPEPINVVMFCESDRIMTIDEDRQVAVEVPRWKHGR